MHNLEFIRPNFRQGLNITIRDSAKWAERIKPGDIVRLTDIHNAPYGCAQVFDVRTLNFEDIPDVWFVLSHDKRCWKKVDIVESLDRAYPEGWGPEVTAVMFLRLKV